MYLKQLEIMGFKSFAEKTRLDFELGITAIVGPNGCGKTNIVDSIKWAIGEQSAKSLRSGKMEDVIFHGTDERKGISMAEVSLTFDNSKKLLPLEFSEVTVTRRVFRSGESQYFINKNLCRLKDVDDLFMDTGVGMKAYSIFEQGKMDLILSSKPEERRFVFEEAAGISKYKERKKETLHKLENTENNLIRLNDIIKEVQRQISSIERQAAKARRYKKLQEELKALEVKSYVYQLRELKSKSHEFEKDKTITEQEVQKMRDAINAKEAELSELRRALRQIDVEMGGFHEQKLFIETRLVGSRHQIEYKRSKIQDLIKRNDVIGVEADNLNRQLEFVKNSMQEVLTQAEEASVNKKNYKSLMEEKNKIVKGLDESCAELNNKISAEKDLLVGRTAEESKIKNENLSIDVELKGLALKGTRDLTELGKKKRQKDLFSQELSKMDSMLSQQRDVLRSIKQAIKDHEERVFLLKDEVSEINRALNNKQQYFSEKRSEYEILSGQKRSYSGYTDGVKTILENKDEYPGFVGLVNDLITVPKEYVDAVSSVLGNKMQWVVIDTLQNACKAAIKLHEKAVSQTVILVLELLPEKDIIQVSEKGVRAMDVTGYDKMYEKLVRYLLGDTVILPGIDDINTAIASSAEKVVFVTNSGIIVDPHGIVSGGKITGNQVNIICRDTIINELKVILNNLSGDILTLTEKYKVSQERLVQEERHLEIAKNNLYNEEISLGVQENDFLRQKSAHDLMSEEVQVLELNEQEGVGKKEELIKARAVKQKELEVMSEGLKLMYDEIQKDTVQARDLQVKKESEEREYTQIKISLVGVEEKENLLEFKRSEMLKQIDAYTNSASKLSAENKDNGQLIQNLKVEIDGLETEIGGLSKQGADVTAMFNAVKEKRKTIEKEVVAKEEGLSREREETDAVYSQLNERQLRLSEIGLKIDSITQKLSDEFKLQQEAIDGVSLDGISVDAMDQEILTLKDKIEGMGEVSLMAIEEQDELVKRHEFLNSQIQDLINAKDSLLKAITKLNTTTKKMFWDTFCQIKENFNILFCQLFGGGKADLVLIDESDILESGIEIIARPPGKRLQNVSLLSGGEKALTAIALLFSIFKVKPSPFCIMDEIDAPLDDSNIERFTDLLKDVAKTSQFLIVTHNKRTINAAQSLYGITMQESGVSRVVSVKFAPAEVNNA